MQDEAPNYPTWPEYDITTTETTRHGGVAKLMVTIETTTPSGEAVAWADPATETNSGFVEARLVQQMAEHVKRGSSGR